MIHPINSHLLLQNGKYFSLLKLIILQQNIASVWIYGDQFSWNQGGGHEMNIIIQHLVGTLPKYIYDLNTTKTKCLDHDYVSDLNIVFVSQSFTSDDYLRCICPTDYTMVLVPDSATKISLPQERSTNVLQRIAFGTIHRSDIADMNRFQDRSSLFVNAEPLHNLFIPKPLKLNKSAVFRIGLQLRPPTTLMYFLNNTYGFYGPDVQMAEEISEMLNVTVIVQSSVGIEYPRFPSWFNASNKGFNNSVKLLTIRERMIPLNVIYDFYRICSEDADICISDHPLEATHVNRTTFIYPHYKECLRIVVPYIKIEQQFAEKLGRYSMVRAICLAIASLFLSKIILSGSCRARNWSRTFNVILAELFGQKRPKPLTKFWEKVWNVEVLLIAMFSTALLSAISYETLISVKYVKQIDTLDDLIESDLKIFMEQSRSKDFETWGSNLDPRLRSKIAFHSELLNLIRNTSDAAFVWDEGTAWVHLTISEYNAKDDGSPEMRIAKEPLYCGFSSARLLSDSAFRYSINTLNERLFTSGIRLEQLRWNLQYFRSSHRKIVDEKSTTNLQPLTLHLIDGILMLLVGGLVLSCIIFILEICWKRITSLKRGKALQLRFLYGKEKRQGVQMKVIRNKKGKPDTILYCVSNK